jgi:signal transduction histidine kinase
MRLGGLHAAVQGFRHMIPGIADETHAKLDKLRRHDEATQGPQVKNIIHDIETCVLTFQWKTDEIRALLPSENEEERLTRSNRTVREFLERAISMATWFAIDRRPWTIQGDPQTLNTSVDGVFYSALLNLLVNVRRHGWKGLNVQARQALIWVRTEGLNITVLVANNGKPMLEDPLSSRLKIGRRDSGIGLYIVRILLQREGGDIRWLSPRDVDKLTGANSEWLAGHTTFFEFHIPIKTISS